MIFLLLKLWYNNGPVAFYNLTSVGDKRLLVETAWNRSYFVNRMQGIVLN